MGMPEGEAGRAKSPEAADTIVVVPCFNEARRLDAWTFGRFAAGRGRVRLLFVDDGSTDGTFLLLDRLRRSHPDRIAVLRLERNAGKAEAVRRGLLRAFEDGPSFAGYWDADLATPLDAIGEFLGVLDARPDLEMVLGARVRLLGRVIERRWHRHVLGRAFATAASLALGLAVYDTQCGAKLFRASPGLRRLFDEPFRSRWIFDVEVLARWIADRREFGGPPIEESVLEFPLTTWRDAPGSKLRPRDFIRAAADLLAIRLRDSKARARPAALDPGPAATASTSTPPRAG